MAYCLCGKEHGSISSFIVSLRFSIFVMNFCAIAPDMLKFYNYVFQHISEPNDFDLRIGSNSHDVQNLSLEN